MRGKRPIDDGLKISDLETEDGSSVMPAMCKRLIVLILSLTVFSVTSSLSFAQITVPSGFEASIFASGIDSPLSLIFNTEGNLLVASGGTDEILQIAPDGSLSQFAYSCENPLDFSPLYPFSKMAYGQNGELYIGVVGWYDNKCNRRGDVLDQFYRISPEGDIEVAASGTGCCRNPFDDVTGVATSRDGDIYFAETFLSLSANIFKYTPSNGNLEVFLPGYKNIRDIAFDPDGNLLMSIPPDRKLYKIGPDKRVVPFLNGIPVVGMEFDSKGNLFVTDGGRIFEVDKSGNYTLFASGFQGAFDLTFDSKDILYVVENGLDDIIKIAKSNQKPISEAGMSRTVELNSCEGTTVTLDGSASFDPDGDPLSYRWSWEDTNITGMNPEVTLPLGTTTIKLTVEDGKGGVDTDFVSITVEDTIVPNLQIALDREELWPPNHKYVPVHPLTKTEDACVPPGNIELLSATSNEPDNGLGDGDSTRDIVVRSDGSIHLRAERAGNGIGRIYTLTYKATDLAGNTSTASARITVPHHKNKDTKR